MQYLISVIDDTTGSATDAEMVAIDAFNEQLVADGNWVFAGGLASPDAATVIDGRGAEPVVVAGPLAATKEYMAGFWVVDAADPDEAILLAISASRACNRRVEVRPFL